MANRLKSFSVMAKVEIETSITIRAESLEDAVEKATNLKEADFVEIHGEFVGGEVKITGCYEND